MKSLQRRSVLALGAALAAGNAFSGVGTSSGDDDCCPQSIAEPDSWSSFGGTPGNARYVPAEGDFAKPDTVAWEYDETGEIAIADDTVYLRTEDNEIHALEDATGVLEWTTEEITADGTPAVAGDTIYVGGAQLTALDAADGSVRWVREFDSESDGGTITVSSPTVVYGRVYVVVDGTLYALDATDGSVDWQRETVDVDLRGDREDLSEIETLQFETEPVAIADESVYALTDSGDASTSDAVVALDVLTGELRWESSPMNYGMYGPLTATDTAVYNRTNGDAVDSTVFDPKSGGGDYRSGITQHAATGDSTASLDEGHVLATGWSVSYPRRTISGGTLAIVGDTLVVESADGSHYQGDKYLAAYDLEDGTEKWAISAGDERASELSVSQIQIQAISNDTIYVNPSLYDNTSQGQLRALRATTEDSDGSDKRDDEEGSGANDDDDGDDGGSDGSGDSEDSDSDGGNDGEDRDSDSNNDGDYGSGNSGDGDNDEGNDGSSGGDDGEDGDSDGSEDGSPGFTSVAGLTGGSLTLEWLRRRTPGDNVEE